MNMFHKSMYINSVYQIANIGRRCFLLGPVHLMSTQMQNGQYAVRSTRTNLEESIRSKKHLNFDNYKEVFNKKKFSELLRAVLIFRLCSFEWLLKHSDKILVQGERLLGPKLWAHLLKPTLYGQFVAGDNRTKIERTVNALESAGIGSLLGVPMEEDIDDIQSDKSKWYEKNLGAMLESIELAHELVPKYPMVHAKATALLPSKLIAKISKLIPEPTEKPDIIKHVADCMNYGIKVQIDGLDTQELEELQNGLEKLQRIGNSAVEKEVIFMFDAEYTYVNAGINLLTLAMMLNYNTHLPLIFFTYQSYLKGSSANLDKDVEFTDAQGVKFGAKIVRGAYMDHERKRAISHGYPDLINDTYEDTSWRYQYNVEKMLKRIQRKPNNYRIIIATHNEEGVKKSINMLDELGIDRLGGEVFFGQIYGMGDHVTFALGKAEMLVYKALPYGPVIETLAYLVRRMHENKSILKGARRERLLIQQALKDRIFKFYQ